nr:PREDICTED: SEC14-like protein 2 [Bemisia tabaci]
MPPATERIDLEDDQRFALMKFRRNVKDICTKPDHDDHFLLRWLKARNFDPEAAEKMLRESMKWRERWGVDDLEHWEPPEVLQKYYPSGISGFDKDGSPIVVIPFAGLDMYGLLHCVSKSDVVKATIKMLESYIKVAQEQTKIHGQKAAQVMCVIDMVDFNLRQYAWRPAGEVTLNMIQMYEANYPEILKVCYVVNAPKIFSLAFSIVKNFLNDYTIGKIHITKTDPAKWKALLLTKADPDQLPAHFGGTQTDPDGNPRCTMKIRQGGKIHKSYYVKRGDKIADSDNGDYCTVTVKKGEKLRLSFVAPVGGSFLKWSFRTDSHDIRFGIKSQDEEGNEAIVVPLKRVAAHQMDEVGVTTLPVPCTYTVLFDNSYSFLRSKKLQYNIAVTPPIDEDGAPDISRTD